MLDILAADTPALRAKAKRLGIEPLFVGTDVALVRSRSELAKTAHLLVLATDNDRSLLEGPVDGVAALELAGRKDFLHHRNAGLDQVRARILASEGKALVLSFAAVRQAKDPGVVLGRMLQNARVAAKMGVPVVLASFASVPEELPARTDLESFFIAMGLDERTVRASARAAAEWAGRARLRASEAYVAEGIRKTKGI